MGHRSWVRGRRARFSGPVRQARIRRSGQRLEVSSRRSWARIRRSAPGSFLYMRVAAFFQRIPICQLKAVFRFRRFLLSQRMQRLGQVSAVRSGQRSGGREVRMSAVRSHRSWARCWRSGGRQRSRHFPYLPTQFPCPMRFGTETTFSAGPNEKRREKTSRQRRGRENYGMGLIFINMRVLCSSAHRIPTYAGADNKALSSCLCPPRTP